jgi:hypothetical protein
VRRGIERVQSMNLNEVYYKCVYVCVNSIVKLKAIQKDGEEVKNKEKQKGLI